MEINHSCSYDYFREVMLILCERLCDGGCLCVQLQRTKKAGRGLSGSTGTILDRGVFVVNRLLAVFLPKPLLAASLVTL